MGHSIGIAYSGMRLWCCWANATALLLLFLLVSTPAPSPPLSAPSPPLFVFVPHPHSRVINGLLNASALRWITSVPSPGSDLIQRKAVEEGWLDTLPLPHRLFSTSEARQCLRSRRIAFIGDSYVRILFNGMADILLGEPGSTETTTRQSRTFMQNQRVVKLNEETLHHGDSFPQLKWLLEECYYKSIQCLIDRFLNREFASTLRALRLDALFISSVTHSLSEVHGKTPTYIRQLDQLLKIAKFELRLNISWVSAPSVNLHNTPDFAKASTTSLLAPMATAHFAAANLTKKMNLPFVDIESVTKSCRWANCTTDGSHRARFVMRETAQLLLNNLCKRQVA